MLADFDGLRIAPAAPEGWREYEVRKWFRGVEYHFRFRNESGRSRVSAAAASGKPLETAGGEFTIPLPRRRPRRPVEVEVVM